MNNENNNGTVLGNVNPNVSPNPVPNPTPINGVENLNGMVNNANTSNPMPTPEPINQGVNNAVPTPGQNLGSQVNPNPTPDVNPTPMSEPLGAPTPVPAPSEPSPVSNPTPPTPAYTNPQNVNQNPSFQSQNTIGTNPPISLKNEKEPKKKSNKIVFIIIIVLVLAGVGFGTFYILNYTDLLNKTTAKIEITTKDIEVNLGGELSTNITDYATITNTDAKNCSFNTMNVNVNEEGVYEYTVTCGETHKTGKVTVVDNSELKVDLNIVYKAKGDKIDPMEFAKEGSDVKLEFVDSKEVDNYLAGDAGTYQVKLNATEGSKTSEVEGKLIVFEHELKGFLVCTSKEQNVNNLSAQMTVGEKFAIVADGTNNIFGNFAQEIHTFTFSDTEEFDSLLEKYNNGEEISINDITGEIAFDQENNIITITNDKSNDELNTEYGANNMENYSTIRTYFTTTLGYTCKFTK